MRKTLAFLASALFVALMAVSCNNTPTETTDDAIDSLIEEAVVEEESAEDKALTDGVWVNDDWGSKTTYQFSEDGICTVIRPDVFDGGTDTIKWNYTLDGETMKLEQKGDDFSMSKEINVSIKGNKLTITEAGVPMEYKWQAE
ncbi:MAG: hypothetical protein J6T48_11680 [Bacteroidales bacterium]|nr:hypothetical protein [Bacteroidales bacterium]